MAKFGQKANRSSHAAGPRDPSAISVLGLEAPQRPPAPGTTGQGAYEGASSSSVPMATTSNKASLQRQRGSSELRLTIDALATEQGSAPGSTKEAQGERIFAEETLRTGMPIMHHERRQRTVCGGMEGAFRGVGWRVHICEHRNRAFACTSRRTSSAHHGGQSTHSETGGCMNEFGHWPCTSSMLASGIVADGVLTTLVCRGALLLAMQGAG